MQRVLLFWSWNGKITREGISQTLDTFKEQNVGGFFIHARAGLEIEYFSDEWHELVKFAAVEGAKRGLDVYLYDEHGWPSGFAGGIVPKLGKEYQQQWLIKKQLTGKEIKETDCPVIFDGTKLVKKVSVKDDKKYTAYVVEYNPSYTNLLSKKAIKEFIKASYQEYYDRMPELFGKEIKGIFTDEPQLAKEGFPYTPDLFTAFEKEYGYSLKDRFYELEDKRAEFGRLRLDYRRLLLKMYDEAYFKQIGAWCEEHKVIFTGHSAAEDGLFTQIQTQCDVMPSYEYFGMPGIDYLTNRKTPVTLLKQVSSVANQLGKDNVLSETFGGSGHSANFRDLMTNWFYQSMNGINVCCMHLSAYDQTGRRKRDYPPTFSYHLNTFKNFNTFVDSLKLMSENAVGKTVASTLVLNPISSYFANYVNSDDKPEGRNSSIMTHYRMLLEGLSEIGIGYEIGDEFLMKTYADVEDGVLKIGDKKYNNVIIPDCDNVNEETVKILMKFMGGGGKVFIVENLPGLIEGKENSFIKELYANGQMKGLCVREKYLRKQLLINGVKPVADLYTGSGRRATDYNVTAIETES